jgi:TonB family protein
MKVINKVGRYIVCCVMAAALAVAQSTSAPTQDGGSSASAQPQAATTSAAPDSTKLRVRQAVKAVYPLEAKEKHLQGEVVVKVFVDEQGDVEKTEVVSGDPVLARTALDAAKKWKFEPFIKDGKAIKVTTKLPFDFAFKGNIIDIDPAQNADLARSSDPNAPLRVRVSQDVMQGLLIHKVAPVYPPDARLARIQGTVILQGLIGKDGHLKKLKLISGHPILAPAAIGAVEQWRYQPYELKGEPVEVETQITVRFVLGG